MPLTVMPAPDKWGNYWFGKQGPAVFTSNVEHGRWLVFLGREKGFVFHGSELKRFRKLQDAVDVLEALR